MTTIFFFFFWGGGVYIGEVYSMHDIIDILGVHVA